MDERVAQYFSLYSWLFSTIVDDTKRWSTDRQDFTTERQTRFGDRPKTKEGTYGRIDKKK